MLVSSGLVPDEHYHLDHHDQHHDLDHDHQHYHLGHHDQHHYDQHHHDDHHVDVGPQCGNGGNPCAHPLRPAPYVGPERS